MTPQPAYTEARPMRVLVTTASRHGATAEIGDRIAAALSEGLQHAGVVASVDVRQPHDVDTVADYDAVVLGSAIYLGKWLKDATRLVERDLEALSSRPVWLFSSGPITPGDDADNLPWIHTPWAVEHHMFGGKVDLSQLSFAERLAVRAAKAPEADNRSSEEIADWAARICATLTIGPAR